jgi:hypothetical protein
MREEDPWFPAWFRSSCAESNKKEEWRCGSRPVALRVAAARPDPDPSVAFQHQRCTEGPGRSRSGASVPPDRGIARTIGGRDATGIERSTVPIRRWCQIATGGTAGVTGRCEARPRWRLGEIQTRGGIPAPTLQREAGWIAIRCQGATGSRGRTDVRWQGRHESRAAIRRAAALVPICHIAERRGRGPRDRPAPRPATPLPST